MKSTRISRISVDPFFTLAWAKSIARVTHPFDDALITQLIPSAVSKCEAYGRMSIIQTTWDTEVTMPKSYQFSSLLNRELVDPDEVSNRFRLPRGPVTSISSVTVYSNNPDLDSVVINASLYTFRNGVLTFKLAMYSSYSQYDSIVIRYLSGYATPQALLAAAPDLIEAVGYAISSAYEKGETTSLPSGAMTILNSYWTSVT